MQLLKICFDDETSSMDIKNLEQHIIDIRNPNSITLGVRNLAPVEGTLSPERGGGGGGATPSLPTFNRHLRNKNKHDNKSKGERSKVKVG